MRNSIIGFLVFALIACQKNQPGPPEEGGGMDGGGGTFIVHTREEVLDAAKKVWARFALNRADNPLAMAYEGVRDKTDDQSRQVRDMLLKILDLEPGTQLIFAGELRIPTEFAKPPGLSKFVDYIGGKQLHFNENDSCRSPNHAEAAASVSRLDRGGEICLSIPTLSKLATAGLEADLVALLAHELGHLNGFGERDCQALQRYFLTKMPRILRRAGTAFKNIYSEKVRKAVAAWRSYLEYGEIDPSYTGAKAFIGDEIGVLVGDLPRPYSGDDIELGRPENYSDVWWEITELHTHLFMVPQNIAELGPEEETKFPINERVLKDIRASGLEMLDLEKSILEYLYGDEANLNENSKDREILLRATDPAVLPFKDILKSCLQTDEPDDGFFFDKIFGSLKKLSIDVCLDRLPKAAADGSH